MNAPRGYILYRGPSLLDGAPIVAIAITTSSNRKTGDMVQTYILADNGLKPTENLRNGADASICGDCKHRPANGGACYVVVAQGPTAVYKAYLAGKYPEAIDYAGLWFPRPLANGASCISKGRMVRLGTYGDPAAVPSHVWHRLVKHAAGWTGYTHQWRNPDLEGAHLESLRGLVMASCDTPQEREQAIAQGWRCFTVRTPTEPVARGDTVCPAHNVMFRAWHDLSHYELGAGFDYQGEHKVALSHLWHFEEPLRRIIRADTLGQLNFYHFGPSGAFLRDQRAFVWDYLTMGETAAILKHRSAQGLTVH